MNKEQEIIATYEEALKRYANMDSWIRGIVYNGYSHGKRINYGYEIAEEALKAVERIKNGIL